MTQKTLSKDLVNQFLLTCLQLTITMAAMCCLFGHVMMIVSTVIIITAVEAELILHRLKIDYITWY